MSIKKVVLPNKEIRFEVRVRPLGAAHQIRRRFEKKVDAQEFLDSVKDRKRETTVSGSPKAKFDVESTTFEKEADFWLQSKKDEFTDGYLRVVEPALKRIKTLYGSWPISSFNPGLLVEFRKSLKSEGLSPATQNRYTDFITRIIGFSHFSKRIGYDPTEGYQKLKENSKEMDFWDADEIYTFLNYANRKYPRGSEKRWIYVAYLMELETGVRANELWGIKLKDRPVQGTKISISRQYLGNNKFDLTKGKVARYVPFSQGLRDELKALLNDEQIEQYPERTLFVNNAGSPIDHNNFKNRVFVKDVEESGVRLIRFHDLRHTTITNWIRNGINIVIVQKMAGHKDLKTTMRYVHVLGREIEDVGQVHGLSIQPSSSKKLQVVS